MNPVTLRLCVLFSLSVFWMLIGWSLYAAIESWDASIARQDTINQEQFTGSYRAAWETQR